MRISRRYSFAALALALVGTLSVGADAGLFNADQIFLYARM